MAVEHGHLVLLQEMADTAVELIRDVAAALHHLAEVEGCPLDREPEQLGVLDVVIDLGGAQQRLRRNAAPIEADAAEMLRFDHRRLHAELSGADRCDIAAGSTAEDRKSVV